MASEKNGYMTEYEMSLHLDEVALTHGTYPGSIWLHEKSGNKYWIDMLAFREDDMSVLVLYRKNDPAVTKPVRFTRPVEEFVEKFSRTSV